MVGLSLFEGDFSPALSLSSLQLDMLTAQAPQLSEWKGGEEKPNDRGGGGHGEPARDGERHHLLLLLLHQHQQPHQQQRRQHGR